jgi:colicin import membrane protein
MDRQLGCARSAALGLDLVGDVVNDISIETEESAALAVIPRSAVSTIIAADEHDILGKLSAKVKTFKPDVSTLRGRKEIASLAAEVASSKMDLVRLANGMMEADRKRIAAILAERKIIEDRMDELKVQVRQSLTDFESAEKNRVADHEQAIQRLAVDPSMEHATSEEISAAISWRLEPEARNWQEFHQRALDAHKQAIATLSRWREAAQNREEQTAELARLRAEEAERQRLVAIEAQKEREARIAAEAAERAKQEAERIAEREHQAAETRRRAEIEAAERERHAARAAAVRAEEERDRLIEEQAKARRDAEEAARKAEADAKQREIAAAARERKQAEDKRIADEAAAAKRAADLEHRRQINGEVVEDLVEVMGIGPDDARAFVVAVATGKVRHTRIGY